MVSYNSVVMLSGGIDSALLTHRASRDARIVKLLHFDFGRSAGEAELTAVKRLAHKTGFQLERVDVRGLQGMMTGPLLPDERRELEYDVKCPWDGSVLGAVTGLGLYYAQIHDIPHVELGFTKEQLVARPSTAQFANSIGEAMSAFNPQSTGVSLHLPLADMTKSEIIQEAAEIGVDFANVWSCVKPGSRQCGVCPGCVDRREAFAKADVADPTEYTS